MILLNSPHPSALLLAILILEIPVYSFSSSLLGSSALFERTCTAQRRRWRHGAECLHRSCRAALMGSERTLTLCRNERWREGGTCMSKRGM
eukprot:669869-Pyramimonas_sp.AAC.1